MAIGKYATIYSKAFMRNEIIRAISAGQCDDDTRNDILMMAITNDLDTISNSHISVYNKLVDNEILTKDDFIIGCNKRNIFLKRLVEGLNVKLSPTFQLRLELIYYRLDILINGKKAADIYIGSIKPEDIAMWVIRMKQNFCNYLQEWETQVRKSAKKIKKNRIDFLAIKAIFEEAMKEYPEVKYEMIMMSRKTKIEVKIPNTNFRMRLDGWWHSYKECLPRQIDELKALIDSHRTDTAY